MSTEDFTKTWAKFCRDLEAAGQTVLQSDLAATNLERLEGLRYITRLMRIGLDMHLENADPEFPSFYQASHATAKIGADNPDNFYQNATISGEKSYLIRGQRGTVPILSFGTKANRYAVDGTMASTGELDIRDVEINSDGSFEIMISREKQDGNWLPLQGDSTLLIVRQTFFDKTKEVPAMVEIECLDGPEFPESLTLANIEAAFERVPAFINGTSSIFLQWAKLFQQDNRNALNTVDQTMFFKAGGDPMIHYLHGWWELTDTQALRITSAVPECEGWNFQINNIWMESLDYRHHRIHTNNGFADLNTDGTVTLIVSPTKQPGNWINTAGHTRGTMLWRWTGAKQHPLPTVEVIHV